MKITKEAVLENLEEVKKYIQEEENKKEEKVLGIAIKNRWTGNIIFQSTKTTYKEAVREALDSGSDLSGSDLRYSDLRGSDLSGSDLRGSDLRGSEMQNVKLYGRGGNSKIKRNQLDDFLRALGFIIEN